MLLSRNLIGCPEYWVLYKKLLFSGTSCPSLSWKSEENHHFTWSIHSTSAPVWNTFKEGESIQNSTDCFFDFFDAQIQNDLVRQIHLLTTELCWADWQNSQKFFMGISVVRKDYSDIHCFTNSVHTHAIKTFKLFE